MIKAEKVLASIKLLRPGSGITWTIYEGNNILKAIDIENYVKSLFKSGSLFTILSYPNKGIEILSFETEYDDIKNVHKLSIEGIVQEIKFERGL